MNIRKLALQSQCCKGSIRAAVLVLLLAGLQIPILHANPILLYDSNGLLHGANGVDVGGFQYNVRFHDGVCASIWAFCDSTSFLFKHSTSALAASKALLDQVFLDLPEPHLAFDSAPHSTIGIQDPLDAFVHTPWAVLPNTVFSGFNVLSAIAKNSAVEFFDYGYLQRNAGWNDEYIGLYTPADENFGFQTQKVWARWSVAVPEPSVMLLMTSGLIAFGAVRRKARN